MRINEIKNQIIYQIEKWGEKIKQEDLKYKTKNYTYDFQQYEKIRSFGESIYAGIISIHEAEMDQINLLENMIKFNNKSRRKPKEVKGKKINNFDSVNAVYEGQELTLNAFISGIFPIKEKQEKRLKILTPKRMLERLQIALAQVKAANTSEILLNEIR